MIGAPFVHPGGSRINQVYQSLFGTNTDITQVPFAWFVESRLYAECVPGSTDRGMQVDPDCQGHYVTATLLNIDSYNIPFIFLKACPPRVNHASKIDSGIMHH